jgi:short-subunit dehydrogenase
VLQRCAIAAATAAASCFFCCCDCNPSLFLADQWFRCGMLGSIGESPHFQNRCIWIVGSSSGIGEEMAYQLASPSLAYGSSKKNSVLNSFSRKQDLPNHPRLHLILSSRSVDKLEEIATRCRSSNPNCSVTILELDVTENHSVKNAIHHLSSTFPGQIDTIVLNAGRGHLSPALETSASTTEMVYKQTALWPMILTPLLFQCNLFRSRPHIVVTSSVAALLPVPLSSSYAAAKHALLGYFRSLHAEQPSVLLHTILPGPVDTDFHFQNQPRTHGVQGTKSPMKMSVQRCAQLMISTMQLPYSTESWIAQQPLLLFLYLQKWLPTSLMHTLFYSRVGPKRIAMWREGLDLYDPKSWRK